MKRRDAFAGAANFIDLLAGLFLVLLVAFAYYLYGMAKLDAQKAEEARKTGPAPAEIAMHQTDTAVSRFRGFLNSEPMTRGSEDGDPEASGDGVEGQAAESLSQPAWSLQACDAKTSPTIVTLAPGMVRLEFGQSLFKSGDTKPVAEAYDCLRRLGLILVENLTSPGGNATTDNPMAGSPCLDVQIQAHADAKLVSAFQNCTFKDNLDLSALRAIETERIMINDLSADSRTLWSSRVSVAGYGDRRPKPGIPPESDENRRVWVQVHWRWNDATCGTPPLSFDPEERQESTRVAAPVSVSGPLPGRPKPPKRLTGQAAGASSTPAATSTPGVDEDAPLSSEELSREN